MTLPAFEPAWLDTLAARAVRAPRVARLPLHLGTACIGSLAPALPGCLGGEVALRRCGLRPERGGWGLPDEASGAAAALLRLGDAVRDAGLAPDWRDEPLPVRDGAGRALARVPRGLARLLAIRTYSVHLIGLVAGRGTWVQRRALDKAEDPGQWDTLMSGTVGAGETVADTLARETWEEAGLRIGALAGLRPCGTIRLDRPQRPDDPLALRHQVESIDCFVGLLDADARPENRDGEVIAFECLGPTPLLERLRAGAFTLEASLALGLAGAAQ